ncbi:amidohydrolase family protein [Mycolicibacterium sp.]|uniref:amidohydrolase family protein n=1 Tax=Mycolicibacterium sp. TaxID=2320850 RepID=UPI003D0B8D29
MTVIDVHAHYIPTDSIDMMAAGRVPVALHEDDGVPGCIALRGMRVGATIDQLSNVDSMLAAMDAAGVDVRVISPPPFTYRYWADPEETLRLHRRLNEATAAVVARHPDRFVGLATAPIQAPEQASAELQRALDELGLAGLTVGTNVDGGNLSDDGPSQVLRALAERGAPLLVHPDFVPNERIAAHYLVNLLGMPHESAIALANLILSGRLDEITGLRVCFVHGGGTLPYLIGRLDKGWAVRPETRSATAAPPSQRLDRVWFDSLTHSPLALRYLIDLVGREHVVVGSDSPFDVEEAQPLRRLRECPGLTADEEAAIVETSAMAWLRGPHAHQGTVTNARRAAP